jgi:hypothetical protein
MRLSWQARRAAVVWMLTAKEPGQAVTVDTAHGAQGLAVHVTLGKLSAG